MSNRRMPTAKTVRPTETGRPLSGLAQPTRVAGEHYNQGGGGAGGFLQFGWYVGRSQLSSVTRWLFLCKQGCQPKQLYTQRKFSYKYILWRPDSSPSDGGVCGGDGVAAEWSGRPLRSSASSSFLPRGCPLKTCFSLARSRESERAAERDPPFSS